MLPKDLLDARRRSGRIYLNFATQDHLKLAKAVIVAFKSSIGQSYGELQEKLSHMERAENYRKVRGFARIIERECRFERPTSLDPPKVRKLLWERGYVTSELERAKVLHEVAESLGVSIEEVERAMFADLDEEKVLAEVPDISPEELIRRYNLSLLQTLMFNALRMTFKISSNFKEVFRAIKRLGLMYEIYGEKIEVTGPASLLKLTRKYGTSLAKLIPGIVKAEEWWIFAEVLEDKRIYRFELSSEDEVLLPKMEVEVEYDSSLEREFAGKIKRILGANVIYEPGILKAGDYIYIPDFLIEKNGRKVYIEIAGFWTREYIRRKLKKLKELDEPLIIIANDELLAEKLSKVGKEVILMKKGKIPYKEVIMKIKEYLKS
ncbi:translation initiation factor IF-2 [Thermococcus chitonophagus]|uniref:Translation initiation factor IF-2 n=1 Tax=Thermococcus chitonophagus TaxID=54262 RepID=A0A160VU29_9EURY|nr:DUF790 family protein [Thermococcus chitonophagus]ASJ17434.1 translation initiation factor IF-2 [Thermococcus chitonophagus]CUX78076.1 Hypothetical protein (associated with DNA helicase-Rad25 homolog) [Thermococcus chitonophagus]